MPVLLVLIFVGIPLLEIVVILQVGSAIGGWPTAALLVIDSLVGAWLLRHEGRRAWSEFRTALNEGRWPGDEVAQGALIIVGGTLLVTPGFVTDAVGFLLLLAPTRRIIARSVRSRVGGATGTVGTSGGGASRSGAARSSGDDLGLDVEVVEIQREQPSLDQTRPERDDGAGPGGGSGPGGGPGPDTGSGPRPRRDR